MDFNNYPVESFDWNFLNALNCLGINGVALFFMISGALILNDSYKLSLKKLFGNKVAKLMLAYYITLFFYNVIPFLKGWAPFEAVVLKENLLEAVIYGEGVYHLWFIPVLVVLYLLAPILKEAFRTKKVCEYYLVLFGIIGAFLPTLLMFDLPGPINRFVTYYQGKLSLFMVTGYIGYFILGHYLHSFTEELSKKRLILIWMIFIAASLFTIIMCSVQSVKQGSASSLANTPLSANVLLSSSGLYLLIKHYGSKIRNVKVIKLAGRLSGYTLGMYLLHPFVIESVPFLESVKNVVGNVLLITIIRMVTVTGITFVFVFVLDLITKKTFRIFRKD